MVRRAPALASTTLNLFVRLLESFLGSLILLKLRRDSGIPQALAEVSLPERPSYYAVHPQLQEYNESWQPLAESSAPKRANAAAQAVPGVKIRGLQHGFMASVHCPHNSLQLPCLSTESFGTVVRKPSHSLAAAYDGSICCMHVVQHS